jgi:hypothetical protein
MRLSFLALEKQKKMASLGEDRFECCYGKAQSSSTKARKSRVLLRQGSISFQQIKMAKTLMGT